MTETEQEYETRINSIREKLYDMAEVEYKKYNYVATKKQAKTLKNQDEKMAKDIMKDSENLKYKVNQMIYMKNKKKEEEEVEKKYYMDTDNLDIYNEYDDTKEYLEWRRLDMEVRQDLLQKYFAEFAEGELSELIKQELEQLVNDKKILYKKDINYDKINKKIVNITLLKKINNEYVLKEDVKKVNKYRQNKLNVNKILKKH